MRTQDGFIAALDQSGGSTPKALNQYGLASDAWSGDEEMYALVHKMRTRIVTTPAFNGDRILGAILFENTMDREIEGRPTSDYLWNVKRVVPFLKVDKGLADEKDGVQLMKPMPSLAALLDRAKGKGIFGTKMRSVVKQANRAGIDAILDQQFEVGRQIVAAGLVPIIEPEVDDTVMLKLTLPDEDNLYADCIAHRNCLRVVALSGGYSREEANRRLARQTRMVASFSRALVEGLTAQMSDAAFDEAMDQSIQGIFEASRT
jgi:fructose-bisphosphate aldolase class I